jgi:hypothetical protein
MKKIMTVTEVEGEGLTALLGEQVILFCMNYFYAGKLVGVNDTDVQLEDAKIVYETGPFDAKTWQSAERLPAKVWYVRTGAIESYGSGK